MASFPESCVPSPRRIERNMTRRKSATARRREGMADNMPTRALVLPLALSPDQHAMYARLADLYNRVWGSAVSWYDANRTVNAVGAHKALYAGLRDRFPQLPSQFVCNALRDAAGAVRSWNSNHPKRGWSLRASRKRRAIKTRQTARQYPKSGYSDDRGSIGVFRPEIHMHLRMHFPIRRAKEPPMPTGSRAKA